MTDIAIRVENLSKLYHIGASQQRHDTLRDALVSTFQRSNVPTFQRSNDLWALKDVSFEVKRGEVVGIIGRNGAGKSTLLKILSRITEPTSGRVELHGRVGSLLEVGTGFHPELTGRENIYLNGAILGMKRTEIDRQFDEIVAFAEIEKFLDTPVKRYSSGMYVRLAFAVAAHLEPEILLVDEVLAVGDAAFQKKCLGKMGDVAKEGRTVLFVSHNMNAISQLCTRVLLVETGRMTASGSTVEVIPKYLGIERNWSEHSSLGKWEVDRRPDSFIDAVSVNGNGLPAEVVLLTNQSVEFCIHLNPRKHIAGHFRAGFHISTQEGIRIMSIATPWSNLGDALKITGPTTLICTMPALPLLPGKYLISIGCMDGTKQLDWLDNVCLMNVVADELVSKRLIPTQKTHGYFFAEASWRLETMCNEGI